MLRPTAVSPLTPALWLLVGFALLTLHGCEKDDDPETPVGDLSVAVVNLVGDPVPGVTISSTPELPPSETDDFGTVTFRDLPVTTYEIIAQIGTVREKRSVRVAADELSEVSIMLPVRETPAPVLAPRLTIVTPRAFSQGLAEEPMLMWAQVGDSLHPANQLQLTWTLDGAVIRRSSPATSGVDSFRYVPGYGQHRLAVRVTNPASRSAEAEVIFTTTQVRAIALAAPVVDGDAIELRWSRFASGIAPGYLVQLSSTEQCAGPDYGWETIATRPGLNDTTFRYVPSDGFREQYCFRVVPAQPRGYDDGRSNTQSVSIPIPGRLSFLPSQIIAHESDANRVYLVDRGLERVVLYDIATRSEVATAQLSGKIGHVELADAGRGSELFVPSSNGYVFVLDPATLATRLEINNQIGVGSVAVFAEGFVVVGGLDDQWSGSRLKSYSRATGQLIDIQNQGLTYPLRLARVPAKLAIIGFDTGLSPASSYYITVDAKGKFTGFTEDQYHGDHPLDGRVVAMAPSGEYFVSSAQGSVYSANAQMAFRGALDHSGLSVGAYAFSPRADTIYSAITGDHFGGGGSGGQGTRGVIVTRYPSRLRERIIVTRGYCIMLARLADGRLGSIQVGNAPSYWSEPTGPAIFAIVRP